jgi:hypothetical protein
VRDCTVLGVCAHRNGPPLVLAQRSLRKAVNAEDIIPDIRDCLDNNYIFSVLTIQTNAKQETCSLKFFNQATR